MTKLLEQAFSAAARLAPEEQDAVAALLLRELTAERKWAEAFAQSQAELGRLADEALAEFERGETRPIEELLEIAHH